MTNPLLDAALQYAGRGWRVFPLHSVWFKDANTPICTCYKREACKQAGKHPRIATGFKAASIDSKQIEEWWSKWPDANIGIATGSGLTVMDIDGEQGQRELLALVAAHEMPPDTLTALTGNGAHAYWNLVGPGSSAKGKVHIRGEGGYVVAPPSMHYSGRQYAWANQAPVSVPPEWLAAWLHAGGDDGGKSGKDGRAPPQRQVSGLLALPLPAHIQPAGGPRLAELARIGTPWSAHEETRLRSALAAIPPSIDGKTWVSIGRALHDLEWTGGGGADIGLELWDSWSRKSEGRGEGLGEYKGREDIEKRWVSFGKPGSGPSFTIASVFHLAKKYGWGGKISPGTSSPEESNGHAVGVNGATNGFFPFGQTFSGAVTGGRPIFLDTYKNGDPKATCVNTQIAIRAIGLSCKYDEFHEKYEIGGKVMGQWAGELTDKATQVLCGLIHKEFEFDPGSEAAHNAVVRECLEHSYDPIKDYLDRLEWDRKPRLGQWMAQYLGAEASQLNTAVGALGLIAACRRVRVPGAKFDAITVLISDEGYGKSRAIEILAGEDNFNDQSILNLDEKAQQEMMRGVWLYEIADMVGGSKADVDKVKAFASRRIDRARAAYARDRSNQKRRCVFYATTNYQTFLKSPTGNRRFWPVQVGKVNWKQLEKDRDQIWAEANMIEQLGHERVPLELPEVFWGETTALQLARLEPDAWDDILAHVNPGEAYEHAAVEGSKREYRISSRDLFEMHLKIPSDRLHDGTYKRLAHVMRRLGWEGPKMLRIKGSENTLRGFTKTA